MRKLIVAMVMGAVSVAGVGSAFAAEKHPPKFGVKDSQCASDANQPHCPGNH